MNWMSEPMLRRVAKAIRSKMVNDPITAKDYEDGCGGFVKVARAAMETMREPTDAMMAAGHGEILEQSALPVWQAMIDEALK